MPKFTRHPISEKTTRKKEVPEEVFEECLKLVAALTGTEATLELEEDENLDHFRKGMVEAGLKKKKYLKIRKLRGKEKVLSIRVISKEEFEKATAKKRDRI